MSTLSTLRAAYRPQGIVSATCRRCAYFDVCGGIDTDFPLLNCFDLFCPGNGKCQHVCPCQSDFVERMEEVRGLRFDNLSRISQVPLDLPPYIPVIHHGYRRVKPLRWPVVALDTYECFRLSSGTYQAAAKSPRELRTGFRLHDDTRIVMRGTAKDLALEKYWEFRRRDRAPAQLATLDVLAAVGPNFSHFLGVPRTDNLFNRKRQLICLEELHAAGISPIPHLNAVMPGDWRFWKEYLVENPAVFVVAIEFQTGNRNRKQGCKALGSLSLITQELGRTLHPVIVGGCQFIDIVADRFDKFTLMDSEPFMKAVKRRAFEPKDGKRAWRESYSLERQPLDDLVHRNVEGYSEWVESKLGCGRPTSLHPTTDLRRSHASSRSDAKRRTNGRPAQPR